jgi:hypothetical protein
MANIDTFSDCLLVIGVEAGGQGEHLKAGVVLIGGLAVN